MLSCDHAALTFSLNLQAVSAEVIKTIRDIIALNPLYRSAST